MGTRTGRDVGDACGLVDVSHSSQQRVYVSPRVQPLQYSVTGELLRDLPVCGAGTQLLHVMNVLLCKIHFDQSIVMCSKSVRQPRPIGTALCRKLRTLSSTLIA